MLRNLTFATIVVMTTTGTIPHHAGAASYGDDAAFLRRHTEVIELSEVKGLAKVAVVPAWQGLVLAGSTAN